MVMDAGAESDQPAYACGTRLPPWLLPGVAVDVLCKLRPDIMLIEGLQSAMLPPYHTKEGRAALLALSHAEARGNCIGNPIVHIVEVGYTADRLHPEKFAEKTDQHKVLAEHLRAAGWTVQYHVVTLGVSGTVCSSLHTTLVKHLGVEACAAKACMQWLHKQAVHKLQSIVRTRRELERKPP